MYDKNPATTKPCNKKSLGVNKKKKQNAFGLKIQNNFDKTKLTLQQKSSKTQQRYEQIVTKPN